MKQIARMLIQGNLAYKIWGLFLVVCIVQGFLAYTAQFQHGLIVTHMRDSVSWAYYIGNFTFLVGVAASAVLLVVPAYVYNWKPIKEVVIYGELLAVAAITMCLLYVLVDMGHPERLWHMIPFIGVLNFPSSLLAWDAIVLNAYLIVNTIVVIHLLWSAFHRRPYNKKLIVPLVIASIPIAIAIHTVTAFLYNGMIARPYWNSAILAPRFLASAFCSGPAVLLILFQVLRRVSPFEIKDEAIHKIAELMAYAMGLNLFLFGAEIFKEYYSNTHHIVHYQYLFFGYHDQPSPIALYAWTSLALSVVAFLLFVIPATRRNFITMNIGALFIYFSVYIEKGIALIIPGYTPDTLGQVYLYTPSITEIRITIGIFGVGFLLFTLLVRTANYLLFGKHANAAHAKETAPDAESRLSTQGANI